MSSTNTTAEPLWRSLSRRFLEGLGSAEPFSRRERLVLACGRHLVRIGAVWVILGYVGRKSLIGALVVYACAYVFYFTLPKR